jgi:hypothetical protein
LRSESRLYAGAAYVLSRYVLGRYVSLVCAERIMWRPHRAQGAAVQRPLTLCRPPLCASVQCLLYSPKWTFVAATGMSDLGQLRALRKIRYSRSALSRLNW